MFSIRPSNKRDKDKKGYGALRDVKWGTGLLCDRHSHLKFAREHTGAVMQARLAQHWLSNVQPTPTEEVWASIGAAGRTALETSDATGVLTKHQATNHAHLRRKQREGSVPANSVDGVGEIALA
ncbi:g7708 [Coccomyxa elongata]